MGMPAEFVYKRILLKLSGEALLGKENFGIDLNAVKTVGKAIGKINKMGVEVALVIGGGNLFRGEKLAQTGLDRITCDHMGMLATIMNGLAIRDCFSSLQIPVKLMTSIEIPGMVECYDRQRAMLYLEKKQVVVFVGGTGCPLFSTDSAASLRGIEVGADIILKATKVDGVYSSDPQINLQAKRFSELTYQEVLDRQLKVMDLSAIYLCQTHQMPLRIFDMNNEGILERIVRGAHEGTLIRA